MITDEEKIILYLTMYATIKHFWFTVDISPIEGNPSGIDSSISYGLIISSLSLTFAAIIILLIKRKRDGLLNK